MFAPRPSPFLLAGAVATLAAPAASQAATYRFHLDHVLGASLDILAAARREPEAVAATMAACAEITRLDRILSAYRPDSELQALNAAAEMAVSTDLHRVITASEKWRHLSGGAFSGRQGRVIAAWRAAAAAGAPPDRSLIADTAAAAEAAALDIDPDLRVIRRPSELVFALDGLAKGYIVDAALAAARRAAPGLSGMMVDIGGDVACWGGAGAATGWRVGVTGRTEDNAPPVDVVTLRNRAIAVSGSGARDVMIGDQAFSHLVSPRTGWPIATDVAVAAVADTAMDADALATAVAIMPPAEGLALATGLSSEALLMTDGDRSGSTPGWRDLIVQTATTAAPERRPNTVAAAGAIPWPDGFQLGVGYEIPKFNVRRYEAPYVIIWVTDEAQRPVRTLLMLGARTRFVSENYVWWRRYGAEARAYSETMARQTRPPGRYLVMWDGRDDAGRSVGQGRYTLNIEASREHGGHTYETIELDLGSAAVERSLAPKEEIGSIVLRYGTVK